MEPTQQVWFTFAAVVALLFAVDFFISVGKEKDQSFRAALAWSIVWILVALGFNLYVERELGRQAALEFFTAYVLERSLSIDNIFVFMVIFKYFHIPKRPQRRILQWGILGALALRLIFIVAGVALIHKFTWVMYLFGVLLVYSGIQLVWQSEHQIDPEKNPVLRLLKMIMPISTQSQGQHFFIREKGRLMATPLLVALVVVETSDVIFAVDSIPAVLAISSSHLIVYSSNIFAILGLRAMYFAMAGAIEGFAYLKYALAAILVFIGVKMLIVDYYEVPTTITLGVIFTLIVASILASWARFGRAGKHRA